MKLIKVAYIKNDINLMLAIKLWLTIEYRYDSAPYQPKKENRRLFYKTQSSNC